MRITQQFGARYDYYMTNFGLPGHEGLDMGGRDGDPVRAAAAGVVKRIVRDNGKHPYGSYMRITHPGGYETIYAHLRGFVAGLMEGDRVRAGQQIGYMGSSGNSTGTHLHLSLKHNGVIVNPSLFMTPRNQGV